MTDKRLRDVVNEAFRMIEWFLNHLAAALLGYDVTMIVGETYQIVLNITPSDALCTYQSSNVGIITVNSDGLVTAIAVGNAEIKVTVSSSGYKTNSRVLTFEVLPAGSIRIGKEDVENSATQEWDEYGIADYVPQGVDFTLKQAYTVMPYWVDASLFVDVTGTGTEILTPMDFRIIMIKESINVGGVMTLCYSKIRVLPFSTTLPTVIVGGKISLRALCKGAVTKPV